MPETSICKNCTQKFEITDEDFAFYRKISPIINGKTYPMPAPTHCPDCRQIRRLVRRNERNLYSRTCDLCKRKIVSIYPEETEFPVYCGHCWWSDSFDSRQYGMDFNFSHPFFEQFGDLQKKVPRMTLYSQEQNNTNSEYTNHSDWNKNCYMCFNSARNEDCYYSTNFNLYNKNCVDGLGMQHDELCYDCVSTKGCYASIGLLDSENCVDSAFLYNCIGCENCFMSYNLRHKKYVIRNKQSTKEEYEKVSASFAEAKNLEQARKEFIEYIVEAPRKYCTILNCEISTGDHLTNCKNVQNSFYGFKCKDVKFAYDFGEMKDCYDIYEPWQGELQYESYGVNESYGMRFVSVAWRNNDLTYCDSCFNAKYLFGCIGIHNQKYCIFNKQYEKEEYEKLAAKIIEHMMETKEWGEFFPTNLTVFPYNESVAQEYFSLTREQALAKGFTWREKRPKEYQKQTYVLPENIKRVPETITNELLACEKCGKNYKIIPQEFDFYKKMNLPIPRKCFDCRHMERMALRSKRQLWDRKCNKCGIDLKSVYDPESSEKIYCEKCFNDFIE